MHRSTQIIHFFLAAFLAFLPFFLSAQTITYQNPDGFSVCGTATFEVTVTNNGGTTLSNITVAVAFSTLSGASCSVAYVPGSVAGASESNISNLGAPVFSLFNLPTGGQATFTITAEAPCATVACIDGAELFANKISLVWNNGNTNLTTDPYSIDRPLLIITNVANTVLSGRRGDVLQRKITVRNTRPGPLESFVFTDTYQAGIGISAALGADISPGGNVLQRLVGAADFAAVGDGDGLFELNESMVITEEILITDCGYDLYSAASMISVAWGCEPGEICQQENTNAAVLIQLDERKPNLVWEPITAFSECTCDAGAYRQGLKITNTGEVAALNLVPKIRRSIGDAALNSIVVDSAGLLTVPPLDSLFIDSIADQDCTLPASPLLNEFAATIPSIGPGESVTLFWDVYFCSPGCAQPGVRWEYRYKYSKTCLPDTLFWHDYTAVADLAAQMRTFFQPDNLYMEDGSSHTATYHLVYDSLALLDDSLVVSIILPCGLFWDAGNEMLLGGQAPLDITNLTLPDATLITAVYQLPLSADSVTMDLDLTFLCEDLCEEFFCRDTTATSCPVYPCIPGGCSFSAEVITTIVKCPEVSLECNQQSCTFLKILHDCQPEVLNIKRPPGYLAYTFDAARTNFGLPDNNNDQLADGSGSLNFAQIRRDRLMAGDTIGTSFRGVVVMDSAGYALPFAKVQIEFLKPQMSTQNANNLLSEQGISHLATRLRIFDKNQNAWYLCNSLAPVNTAQDYLSYDYLLSGAGLAGCGGLPPGFNFENGDSILLETDFRVNYNLQPQGGLFPLLGNFTIYPSVFLYDDASLQNNDTIDCHCESKFFEITGYKYSVTSGPINVPPCNPSPYNAGTLFRLDLNEGNFFPFEYRTIATVSDWQVTVPAGFTIQQARLTFLRHQGGTDIFTNQLIAPVLSNGVYHFYLDPFWMPSVEEGFLAFVQYIFGIDCQAKGNFPLKLTASIDFAKGLPEDDDPLLFQFQQNVLRAQVPDLEILAPQYNLDILSDQLVFDFLLINNSQFGSGVAPNTWLYVLDPGGDFSNIQLVNPATGQPFLQTNGIFQLGNWPVDSIPLRLLATNNSCETETLLIHYGWNCDPFSSTVQAACDDNLTTLTVISPPGELEMLVESPSSCSDLCDTIPYHYVEIFNAQLGSAYDLMLTALLPPGFAILSGSAEVEYPTGSGNFFPAGDPQMLGSAGAVWHLSDTLAAIAGGLPGVTVAPSNSLTLRFLGETSCGFVANAYLLFVAAAKQNCGLPTNTIAKPGDPICINGVSSNYSVNTSVAASPGFGCNDQVSFDVSLMASADIPLGACLIVTLPQGIQYVQGSCTGTCQPNFNCAPAQDSNTYTWQLPVGVGQGEEICFTFNTSGWSSQGCGNGVLLFRTASETLGLCAATGDSCSIKASTGSLVFPFEIKRPVFKLDNFMVNASPAGSNDLVDCTIHLSNTGAASAPPTLVNFYLDTDGNGSGDVLVHTETVSTAIPTGGMETLTGAFAIPAGNLCKLVAVVDAGQQCACAGDMAYVDFPIVFPTLQIPSICSGETPMLGVADIPGFSWQWSPGSCVACNNCPMTTFICENSTASPLVNNLVLTGSDNGGCTLEHHFQVTVQPVPGIQFVGSPVCLGETAAIIASEGTSYQWSGPGVVQGMQVQLVSPVATSFYTVTVTDAEGCSGVDSATVVVHPSPVVDAGSAANYCPGEVAQLMATFDPTYSYQWSPTTVGGAAALSNSNIYNPTVLTTTDAVFTVTASNAFGCTASDAVALTFGDAVNLTVSPDQVLCFGGEIVISAFGADGYDWSQDGDCQDAECSAILVSPDMTTDYSVIATNADGCTATASVTVSVTMDTIFSPVDTLVVCEGEGILLCDTLRTEAGLYCCYFATPEGCDSVACTELLVLPGIDSTFSDTSICQGNIVGFEGMTFSTTGLHCISYPGANGCDSTLCLNLTVFDNPAVDLVLELDTIMQGDTVFLSIEPSGFDSILWFGGNITGLCTNSPACEDTLMASATYQVTVFDGNGCPGTDTAAIFVIPSCNPEGVQVPNAFSPDGDGTNDTFDIVSPGDEVSLRLKIWDRWGGKVYDGPGPWDGTQGGKPVLADVFVYLIRVGCANTPDREVVLKGDVTVLR
ncbi:MAG: gliding motility-associated C-terminal domain-containing protein [Lewinellaceae bacterium]|nr:gliding motility-associated C-terminal domain-containing protein [Saprospiraceae bacterium]MCB9336618.1 gliding motility-associated C-terminal domain-containing protein [Lewinellaceae bacterium]